MTWKDITVFQFQALSDIWLHAAERELVDVMVDVCCTCYGLTARQVDSLNLEQYKELCKGLEFLNDIPKWEPVKYVTVDGRRYRFLYDVRKIHSARCIEVKHFGSEDHGGFVANLHKLAASMVIPQKRNRIGIWVDAKYDALDHEDYANDILQAPITAIHGSALFFCEVFKQLTISLKDYLTQTIPTKMQKEAQQILLHSCEIMDGPTMPQ